MSAYKTAVERQAIASKLKQLENLILVLTDLDHDDEDLPIEGGRCSDHLVAYGKHQHDERCLRCRVDAILKPRHHYVGSIFSPGEVSVAPLPHFTSYIGQKE